MIPFLIAFCAWAVVHSLMASNRLKVYLRSRVGIRLYNGWYRLFYNLFSAVSLLPVLLLGAAILPDRVIWSLAAPSSVVFFTIQMAALIGLLVTLWQTDFLHFAGLSQLFRYLSGEEEVELPPKLVTGGAYALVRHPLYFFALLLLWFSPTMTGQLLVFNILSTVYFVLGSIHEEGRLVAQFGEAYRNYMQRVPRLIPIKVKINR